jgi:hypothetical protein
MKIKLIYIALVLVGFSSCRKAEKDFEDYFPEIILSAEAQPDGSVVTTATITEYGAIPIRSIGFSYGESKDSPINENQIIIEEINNNTFTATFPSGFDITKTYYFKAWTTNQVGYKESAPVSISNIEALPVDGPCTNPMDYLYVYGNSESTGPASAWQQDVNFNKYIDVSGTYSNVTMTFDNVPSTGIYQTTQAAPGPGQVRVSFTNTFSVFIQSSLNPNQEVYVNQTSPMTWTIEVCSASYTFNSFNYSFSTFFDI